MASPSGFSTPNAGNVFIPVFDGNLIVGFSRNVRSFKFLNYIKMKEVKKVNGLYLRWSPSNASRVIDQNRYRFADGMRSPMPFDDPEFKFASYACLRNRYPYLLGQLTEEQAEFNVREAFRAASAGKCMTARAMRVATVATTTANWSQSSNADLSADHYSATTSITGVGDVSAGSSTDPRLKRLFNYAQILIAKDTNGQVSSEPAKFMAVFNPSAADKIAASQEYHDYLKSSPAAAAEVEGKRHPNSRYGLPEMLYGVDLCIDDTVKTTSDPGATTARSFVWPDSTLAFMSRSGELDGVLGGENFSTLTMFYHEDMTVEERNEPFDRLNEGAVTENTAEVLTCPHAGFLATSIFTD